MTTMPAEPSEPTELPGQPDLPARPVQPPGDFYLDGGRVVFTVAYHLRRGTCCGSRCRHCPYNEWKR